MDKKQLRKQILSIRNQLSQEEVTKRSGVICERLAGSRLWSSCKNVCLYMPIRNEVDVTMLFDTARTQGKKIWLPKVCGDLMDFYLYDEKTKLVPGKYDIKEPESSDILEGSDDTLVVMPGAVFSKENDRIGYGGGYYDRYLEKYPKCHTIAVCYDFQIVDSIPVMEHDKKPDIVISDSV